MTSTLKNTSADAGQKQLLSAEDIVYTRFEPVVTVEIPLKTTIESEKLIEMAKMWIDSERDTFTREELEKAAKENFYKPDEVVEELVTMKMAHTDEDGFRWRVGKVHFDCEEDRQENEFTLYSKHGLRA